MITHTNPPSSEKRSNEDTEALTDLLKATRPVRGRSWDQTPGPTLTARLVLANLLPFFGSPGCSQAYFRHREFFASDLTASLQRQGHHLHFPSRETGLEKLSQLSWEQRPYGAEQGLEPRPAHFRPTSLWTPPVLCSVGSGVKKAKFRHVGPPCLPGRQGENLAKGKSWMFFETCSRHPGLLSSQAPPGHSASQQSGAHSPLSAHCTSRTAAQAEPRESVPRWLRLACLFQSRA